ncbi:MAG: hypothetical protein EXX96DRAFT_623462 [Benjaminiella poitrasii]|nr:MAG: hypothetical protein EXX96DRAFT_623462 [Benjaminiella poitrasii]
MKLIDMKNRHSAKDSLQCWWTDEILPSGENENKPYRDFVLISEFSELEGPLPLAIVTESTYINLKHHTNSSTHVNSLEEQLKKLDLDSFDFNAFVLRVVSVDRSTEFEQIDEVLLETSTTTSFSVFEDATTSSLFSIPDDTQVYFTDSEHNFFAFTHHLTLFDINARGYVHPVALSYITRDPDKIINRFDELMHKFNEVSTRMKKGNYSNFILDLKYRLLDLEHTQSVLMNPNQQCSPSRQKPALSLKAIQQAIIATKFMIDTLESSKSQISNSTDSVDVDEGTLHQRIEPTTTENDQGNEIENTTSISPYTIHSDLLKDDYQPKVIDTLSPVAHFERKLRSLAQLCQEPNDEQQLETSHTENLNTNDMNYPIQSSLAQKTAAMIPLVFSMIGSPTPATLASKPLSSTNENSSTSTNDKNLEGAQRRHSTLANTIKRDMYAEVIDYIQDTIRYLGKSSVILDVDDEESLFIEPVSSALTIGRTFMLNMNNPQPREREDHSLPEETVTENNNEKKEIKTITSDKATHHDKMDDIGLQSPLHNDGYNNNKNDTAQYPFLFAPLQLWRSEEKDAPKTHLLEVLRHYQSLIVDVIFSLLTGRTVLVQGSSHNKSHVQEVVQALSFFVPGKSQDKHQIIEWYDSARLTDIEVKSIKLVGVDKENMDSSIHVDSSCVLDIDVKNGSLNSSPVYVEGQWINQFLDRMMLFSSDEAYLAYLHTVFMNMSLKAFIYHHLYVSDEFQLDESPPPSSAASSKGYISETNSESSTLSRKWSARLMNYLKKHEYQESSINTTEIASQTSTANAIKTNSTAPTQPSMHSENGSPKDDEEDYSEENQATVTLQNVSMQGDSKPRTVVGLFDAEQAPANNESIADGRHHLTDENLSRLNSDSLSRSYNHQGRRNSAISNISSSSSNGTSINRVTTTDLDFDLNGLIQYGDDQDNNSYSSSSEEEENAIVHSTRRSHRRYKNKIRDCDNMEDIGSDGISYIERRGRQYLQEKFKVYGDDQTIVIYLATCVL